MSPQANQGRLMTHCFAASSSAAGKCLISAATKCDAKCSATFPNGESVTTPIFNVLVMISHKSKMACHCAEALPAWKGSGLDDETCESSPFFNVGINRFRELHKVALFKLRLRSHIQNRMRFVECVFDHVFAPMGAA
jgi:hypothetical protein